MAFNDDENHVIITPNTDPVVPTPTPVPTPAPTPAPAGPAVSVDSVQKTMTLILKIADGVVKIIPGTTDDAIVAWLHTFATDDWFAQLISYLMSNVNPAQMRAMAMAHMQAQQK